MVNNSCYEKILRQTYLVTAYSLIPLCKFIALKVPIQPRRRRSFPMYHVTNKGLERKQRK